MNLKMPITKKRIKNHFAYAWWQYVLLVVVAVFGWNLLYTSTHYRSPENLKVELYCDSYAQMAATQDVHALMDEVRQTLLPDMEEVTFTEVGLDETYGDMQLMVWVSAGQGDLYLLTKTRFDSLASGGAMIDLQPYVDSGALNVEGVDLANGYVADAETGKLYLVGVPTDSLTKLNAYGIQTEGGVMGILVTGGNTDNTLKLMQYLIDTMREEPQPQVAQ